MKNPPAHPVMLSPDAHGWRVSVAGGGERNVATLGEAIAALPAHTHVELALPCQAVIIERHRLPSTDRAELADMLQLQLEKALPYPLDDVSHGFEVLGQDETESTVLTVATSKSQLDDLCAPLREKGRIPERITLQALRVAAACPENGNVLALWPEQEQTVCAIITDGKLAWAQPMPGLSEEAIRDELPGILLAAELAGVSTEFTEIRVNEEAIALGQALAAQFGKPVVHLGELPQPKADIDLLPETWQAEARRQERGENLKQNLLVAAVVYLVLIAAAFGYLAWMKRQVNVAQQEFDQMKPRFAGIEKQMSRWDTLAPAVEPGRYIVEVLHQLTKAWQQSEKLQFTSFTFAPRDWTMKGEGTTDAHFELIQRLKANKELEKFDMTYPPAQPLKDDRVSFEIRGKAR